MICIRKKVSSVVRDVTICQNVSSKEWIRKVLVLQEEGSLSYTFVCVGRVVHL